MNSSHKTPIIITSVILVFACVMILQPNGINTHLEEEIVLEGQIGAIELIPLDTPNLVEASIRYYSEEYGVDTETALRIAKCESQMGKYKTNWSGSSAKGIYQFISQTWEHYCEGDVMNDEDNIICFMKLYEKNKSWWSCR